MYKNLKNTDSYNVCVNKESQKINGNYKKEAHGWISKYNMLNRLLSEQNSRLDIAEKRICGPEYGSLEII